MKKVKLSNKKEIQIRVPKVRDIKALGMIENPIEKEVVLISNLSGVSIEELDDMELKDYSLLSAAVNDFLYLNGAM